MELLKTPDMPSGGLSFRQLLITVPANADIERFFWGAVSRIGFFSAWQEGGSMTPEEAAEIIKNIIRSRKVFNMLGAVLPVIRDTLDSSMLLCDGSVYNKTDYPQLWDVWPSSMKDATTLTLPDLQNLFLVGAGLDYSLGDTGGTDEVTLTTAEMPSHSHTNTPHSHSEITATPTIGAAITGVPVPSAIPGVGVTGSSGVVIDNEGGDQPHENRPPFYAVVYAVIAKVSP